MTHFYPGLMPWHLEHMTLREINEYLTQMREAQREREASRG